jgi:hypothetical protein
MTKDQTLQSLQATKDALQNIRKELKPFVRNLDSDNPQDRAQAQAVVALSIGTLRYMGARLEGRDEGRSKEDPLRQELNHMRKVLTDLEKKRKADGSSTSLDNNVPSPSKKAKKTGDLPNARHCKASGSTEGDSSFPDTSVKDIPEESVKKGQTETKHLGKKREAKR